MRRYSFPIAAIAALLTTVSAEAAVTIAVDKDAQQMTVAVDGDVRYRWPVSTGTPSYETPNGTHRAFRMEPDHFSKEFDDAPMPHSIFFTKKGHAIHGTFSEKSLGTPVSHGCVRLSRTHAATLYKLVEEQGVLNTTVTLTGSSRVALARRNGTPKASTAVARRDATPDYDANGEPVARPRAPRQLYAQPLRPPPQPRLADNDYAEVPEMAEAPRVQTRRVRRARQAQAYDDIDRDYAPRGYAVHVPPPSYYPGYYSRGRGLFSSGW